MIPIATQYTSYTQARDNFVKVLEEVEQGQGIVVVQRRGHEDVALIAAAELSALLEEVYLLRSPTNTQRLHAAISWANEQADQSTENTTVVELRAGMEIELG